jgi:hypothetical protein
MKDQKNKSKNKKKENTKKVESDKDKAYKANKEEQYKKLEAYISESGLTLAFNIIFAELISKQILPENFFAYTSMRLKQIGKEIEDLKTKIIKPEQKPNNEEEQKLKAENEQPIEKDNNSNEKAPIEEDNLFQTQPTKNIPNKKEVDKKNTTLNSKKSTNSKTSSTNKKK